MNETLFRVCRQFCLTYPQIHSTVSNEFEFFARFLIILYAMEIYDIFFFDWVLLYHSNFYPHFCPECKGMVGPHLFDFNKKTHILHFTEYIPACAVAAWICTLF